MDVMPWQVVVFISIPEAFLLNLMGLTLIGIKPDLKKLGIVAVAQAGVSFFVRALPMVYGIHMILQVITTIILVKFILKYQWRVVLPGVLLGFAVFTGILDQLYFPFVLKIVSLEVILSNTWIRILVSMPQQMAMLVIIFVCRRYNLKVFDMMEYKEGM